MAKNPKKSQTLSVAKDLCSSLRVDSAKNLRSSRTEQLQRFFASLRMTRTTDNGLRTMSNRHFLVLILKLIKLEVNPLFLKQLLVSPHFTDAPFMHDHDLAGVLNGG